MRNEKLKGVKRLKFVFYLNDLKDLNYLNLLRPALLENISMSIVVEERSVKNLLNDAKLVKDEINVIMGKVVPAGFMEAVKLSRGRLKVVRDHG